MTTHSYGEADNAYWEQWREHYESVGKSEEFHLLHRDGVVDELRFGKQPSRILFVLKEPNNNNGGDLREWLKQPSSRKGVTLRSNLARWARFLQNGMSEDLTWRKEECKSALLGAAAINLKKIAGGNKADMGVVAGYANQDRSLLRAQIKSINPSLIVAGGTVELLFWLLDLPAPTRGWNRQALWSKYAQCWVVPMKHPAARLGYRKTLADLKQLAQPCFTAEGELRQC